MTAPPLQLIVGPAGHGVTAYAADVAAAVNSLDPRVVMMHVDTLADGMEIARAAPRVHVHVTDRVLGSSPEDAAGNLERLARETCLTITVHDVPQTSDGTSLERRVSAYSRFFAASHAAVVNSAHEQRLVEEFLAGASAPHAIPLGTRHASPPPDAPHRNGLSPDPRPLIVLISGYIYPGKGHEQAIEAGALAANLLRTEGEEVGTVVVRAIGRPSAGHERDVEFLRDGARRHGVRFEVTGFLDESDFGRRLVEDGIPLAAHEHVSASRSMLDWVEAGRRPLVIDSRYAEEMDLLRPGTIARYKPTELARRLVVAWREPAQTWLGPDARLEPTLVDVAEEYLAWWNAVRPA